MQPQTNTVPVDLTPEQLAAARLIIDQQAQSTLNLTASPEVHPDQPLPAVVIDQVRKQRLEIKFSEVINDPRFWTNLKRVNRLEQAAHLPEYDNKSLQQFAISAEEELCKEALDFAIANQSVPVMPTKEQIRARAEEKYEVKLAKEAEKADKKKK